jgi:class 3 adenylate cyclase/tetratricopeptide (TPR) repeat protein
MPSGTTIERRVITVLIADLVGFTSLSEQLDAEDIQIIQDAYFASVEDVVGRYGGMVQKYIGDAAVATFGLHRAADDDPERAVRAGLALVSAVQRIGERLGMEPDALSLRVGVNTGEVVYSEGGPTRGQFTGDSVNVAARLQTAALPGSVLLGQTTALAIADSIETARVGPLELKGKGEPQPAWEALSIRAERSRDLAMGQLHAPTVGRRAELQWLRKALNDVRRGAVKSRVVVAPPGVGKSRLVAEFAHMVEASAATPVWLARVEAPLALFDVVRQLLDAALRTLLTSDGRVEEPVVRQRLEQAGAQPSRAAAVAGQLVSLLAGSDTGLAARSADRDALFSMWIEGLDALAHPEAAVWVVEDLHWASGDLLAFLAAAGQAPTGQGRLIVATARPSILERAPGWLQSDDSRSTAILQLDPLPQLHSVELIRALVGGALPDDVVATIADRSDGNPLFIEELLRLWTSVGLLARDQAGTWRLMQPPMKVEVPTTVHNIYEAQLDDLPESAREVVRRAGVAGRRFPDRALNELGVEEPEEGLTVLSTRVLIEPTDPDELLGPSHTYRHALLRDAGYATLPRAERARLHVRLALWLEKTAGDEWPALAAAIGSHFEESLGETPSLADEVAEGLDRLGAAGLASVWLERAGQVALDQAESDSARVLFQRALDLTPDDETIHRSRRLQRLGEVTAFAADMNQGAQEVAEAREIARLAVSQAASNEDRMAARTRLAEATAALAWIRQAQLRFAEAAQLSEEAITELGEDGPSELVARLLSLSAFTHYGLTNRFDDVKADAQRAINLASAVGSEATELDATEWMFYPRGGTPGAAGIDQLGSQLRARLEPEAVGESGRHLPGSSSGRASRRRGESLRPARSRGGHRRGAWSDREPDLE